jgi:hypothetical protein
MARGAEEVAAGAAVGGTAEVAVALDSGSLAASDLYFVASSVAGGASPRDTEV